MEKHELRGLVWLFCEVVEEMSDDGVERLGAAIRKASQPTMRQREEQRGARMDRWVWSIATTVDVKADDLFIAGTVKAGTDQPEAGEKMIPLSEISPLLDVIRNNLYAAVRTGGSAEPLLVLAFDRALRAAGLPTMQEW